MLNYSTSDVVTALENAKNSNAAIKKFLKNEVRHDPKSEKFIKSLKLVLASKASENKESFIEKNIPAFEPHLLVLTRYAYAEETAAITAEIINRFAEEFNTTYSLNGEELEIKDPAKFKKIVLEVLDLIEEGFKTHNIPSTRFMKNVLFYNIFDKELLDAVTDVVKKAA